jgi:hypothetical protein
MIQSAFDNLHALCLCQCLLPCASQDWSAMSCSMHVTLPVVLHLRFQNVCSTLIRVRVVQVSLLESLQSLRAQLHVRV